MQLSYPKTKPEVHEAELGTRVLAFCLDTLLLLSIIGLIEHFTISSNEEAWLFKSERLLHLLLGWLYFAGAESSIWQASLGKHLLGIRVSGHNGDRISFRRASLRYLLKPVSVFTLLVQAISQAPTTACARLFHDRICKTRVVT